ncbi:acetoacetate decarboxylase [Sinobacterium caligoides]|uniref:Acetoacetate decarboxylase n=1 Tax=Sinobacterium caligoides TaxID=933926 RepID=A0A3N2DNQ7_9GAMM|nr:acetoacetate decarboxylase family protein [Sinobacterium caligoides]ROS01443.1 acetoacetate decarboxylase [Sinobacterium caligoides]
MGPQTNPGEICQWPMLKIAYRTDADKIAALLPAGIEPGDNPNVYITIYNFPVGGEPEYGYVVNVEAKYQGIAGEFTLAIGIDQENAVHISQERWGQPKFVAETQYYRLGNMVKAKLSHQGYTFLEFTGEVTDVLPNGDEFEQNEWWIKSSRAVDGTPEKYDFPPHVVRVYSKYGTQYQEGLAGELKLMDSPWDPIANLLPMREQLSAKLWSPIFLDRRITLEGELDGQAFWPHADTIGGSRWPGTDGGPKK